MKIITVKANEVAATFEKGENDTNWTRRFLGIIDRGITTSELLHVLKDLRKNGFEISMNTRKEVIL